jgi:hypothetical protein
VLKAAAHGDIDMSMISESSSSTPAASRHGSSTSGSTAEIRAKQVVRKAQMLAASAVHEAEALMSSPRHDDSPAP